MAQLPVLYAKPGRDGVEGVAQAWARVPMTPTPAERA
jgi:hypothetical protein